MRNTKKVERVSFAAGILTVCLASCGESLVAGVTAGFWLFACGDDIKSRAAGDTSTGTDSGHPLEDAGQGDVGDAGVLSRDASSDIGAEVEFDGGSPDGGDSGSYDAGVEGPDGSFDASCPNPTISDRSGELSFGFTNTSSATVFLAAGSFCGEGSPNMVKLRLDETWLGGDEADCECSGGSGCGRICEGLEAREAEPYVVKAGAQFVSPNADGRGFRLVTCPLNCALVSSCHVLVPISSGRYHARFCATCGYMTPDTSCHMGMEYDCSSGYREISKEFVVQPSDETVYIEISDSDLPPECLAPKNDGGTDGG